MPNEASRIRTFANILSVEGICAHGCVWVKQLSGVPSRAFELGVALTSVTGNNKYIT